MNIFQSPYEARLKSWHDLKAEIKDLSLLEKCIKVDSYWQKTPQVSHYLHTFDIDNWPDPWELLVENQYCTVARALGMCYTFYMIGITDFELVEAKDNMGNDVVLVLVDNAKYILNYWPDTVVNNCLQDFTINRNINLSRLLEKL